MSKASSIEANLTEARVSQECDIVVVGAGPAGLAIASACAQRGLSVTCVAPDVHKPWLNNFGTWLDEIEPLGLGVIYDRVWPTAVVHVDAKDVRYLERPYCRIDGEKLRAALNERAGRNLTFRQDAVLTIAHQRAGSCVTLASGRVLSCAIVIDATGFNSKLIRRDGPPADAFQVAYGVMARVKQHDYPLDEMGFMDFRDHFLADRHGSPTFLYAMPFAPDRIFLEETSLVCRPALSFEFHQERLQQRLAQQGLTIEEVEWEERCLIPLNTALPRFDQRTLAFGAAAGFVHPASGYSVSISLSVADPLAQVLAHGLSASARDLDALSQQAWSIIWSPGRLRVRKAQLLGMEIFCRAKARDLRRFLGLFFRAPDVFWHGYLSGRRAPIELARGLLAGTVVKPLPSGRTIAKAPHLE